MTSSNGLKSVVSKKEINWYKVIGDIGIISLLTYFNITTCFYKTSILIPEIIGFVFLYFTIRNFEYTEEVMPNSSQD